MRWLRYWLRTCLDVRRCGGFEIRLLLGLLLRPKVLPALAVRLLRRKRHALSFQQKGKSCTTLHKRKRDRLSRPRGSGAACVHGRTVKDAIYCAWKAGEWKEPSVCSREAQ